MKTIYTGWPSLKLAPDLAIEEDQRSRYYGWLFAKHPDGQWVTLADLKPEMRLQARPASEYHEDFGNVLWWHLPVSEPPHVGTPTDTAWPENGDEYYTHWSPIPMPAFP